MNEEMFNALRDKMVGLILSNVSTDDAMSNTYPAFIRQTYEDVEKAIREVINEQSKTMSKSQGQL